MVTSSCIPKYNCFCDTLQHTITAGLPLGLLCSLFTNFLCSMHASGGMIATCPVSKVTSANSLIPRLPQSVLDSCPSCPGLLALWFCFEVTDWLIRMLDCLSLIWLVNKHKTDFQWLNDVIPVYTRELDQNCDWSQQMISQWAHQ